ncbi:MAG: NADH-quinone oxidoreductase subunit N [Bacteroidales bacterium]
MTYISLMRQELGLIVIALLALFLDLVVNEKHKNRVYLTTLALFGLHTLAGFLPFEGGSLFGGMFNTHPTLILMKNVLNIGVFLVLLMSASWLVKPGISNKSNEFLMILLTTLSGMYFMISAGDFLMFYIGLEIASIPMAVLAAYEKFRSRSEEAGIKFLLNSALSTGFLLFGISLSYAAGGTLYFNDFSRMVTQPTPLIALALTFLLAGLAFKLSLVPFHFWTADVYEGSPMVVTSYFSVISKGSVAFVLGILLFKVFPAFTDLWQNVIYTLAIITMFMGNLFALRQKNIKRFLAFSSIAQAGFILLALLHVDTFGITVIIYFVLIYILSNLAAFGVAQAISVATGKESIEDYNGLYKTNPGLSLIMMLALFSLSGIPPVAGFFSKFFLFTAAAKAGFYWLVLIAVINTTIALYYYLLVVKAMFINPNPEPLPPIRSDRFLRSALLLTVMGIFLAGILSPVYEYIQAIVDKF